MKAKSPYRDLPQKAFWKTGVAGRAPLTTDSLYEPKFPVPKDMAIATAGSCFAQHIGRALDAAGYNVIVTETVPPNIPDDVAHAHGLRMFSARYGNIYTTRQLVQLFDECFGDFIPADAAWRKDARVFDAMRPAVEPAGFASEEDMQRHRQAHLRNVRTVFESAGLFVFTLGLTEAWVHRQSGTVYPTAPGTICGDYDPDIHAFRNFSYDEVLSDMRGFIARMQALDPDIRFLLTTSPVPLAATATACHVEVATAYSKAVLRAVCGALAQEHACVDYFPSYEIITSPNNHAAFFDHDKRTVTQAGVKTAMSAFVKAHEDNWRRRKRAVQPLSDANCEDALLEKFA